MNTDYPRIPDNPDVFKDASFLVYDGSADYGMGRVGLSIVTETPDGGTKDFFAQMSVSDFIGMMRGIDKVKDILMARASLALLDFFDLEPGQNS